MIITKIEKNKDASKVMVYLEQFDSGKSEADLPVLKPGWYSFGDLVLFFEKGYSIFLSETFTDRGVIDLGLEDDGLIIGVNYLGKAVLDFSKFIINA